MMAATKQGLLKKKRTTRVRHPTHDPDPPPPPPPPPAADARRSLRPRRRRPLAGDYFDDDYEVDGDDIASGEEDDEERRRLKLVLKLPTAACRRVSPSSDGEDGDSETAKPPKKRRIEDFSDDSDGSGHPRAERKRSAVVRGALPGTRLPKKAVLFEVLEKLQKKDTYSVFARPVDPEELPDYHDVIEHPMDFGTVRRKVAGGLYRSFEQFEDDVFLICSNAMQYNAPDTVYFRQAHSIQELARKKFQELRADAISGVAARKNEEKNRFHTEEKKTLKKPQCRNAYEQLPSDISPMEKIIKKPHCRTAPDQHRSDFSSMEKKTIKKPQYRASPKPIGSDFSSLEKKTIKDFNGKPAVKPIGYGTSSMEKNTLKEASRKTARELPLSDIASLEKKMLKNPQSRIAPQALDSDIQSENKTSMKVQCKTETSDIPLENRTSKKAQCRTETEPPDSDTSSLEKKTSKTAPCRTAPEPLGSDASSGATLTSAADTCTHTSRLQAQGIVSPAEACTGLSTAQGNDLPSTTEAHIGLSVQTDAVERSVAINESVDGSSSLGESKSEKADEIPVKSSPSKLGMKPFVVDVNRRATYNPPDQEQVVEPDSVFDVFEGEPRELVAVEPQSNYSYARSLSRFAASLGPIAWAIVSKKIEQALPPEVNFGPGWVGEYEPLPTPVLYVGNKTQQHQQQQQQQKQQHNQQQLHNQQQQQQLHNQQQQQLLHNQQQQQLVHNQPQQQRQLQQPQTVMAKDKGNETKSKTAPNGYHNMSFCFQSQATAVKPHSRTSSGVEGTNREWTQDQKQGLFGIDLARQPAVSSPMPQLQKQATGVFSNVYTNEVAAHRPQSSHEAAKSMFLPITPRERNQVQAEPQQQPQSVTPQRRNDAVSMNVSGRNATWRSSGTSRPNTSSGIMSNQQAGVQYWFARGSQEQVASDPLRWMSSSGKNTNQSNLAKVCTNNLERSMPNSVHVRQEIPNATAAQAWMSIGAPAEWKPVDGGGVRNKQVGPASFNSTWKAPAPSRVPDDSKVPQEPVQGVSEASQVQNKGLVIFPQLMTTDLSRLRSPWQGMVQHSKQKDQLPPDLNISFQPPGSPARPSSGIHIDSQQPDLALQL
ncbi:uncharacterized protein M6B38_366915 [Iris pallida]|uniref:Bromo domain-containing protein n=1 Tax=Iris pallida TaxID=29817 RepID=A0AAX6GHE2_IRIPA|nr:uncharacterized protein M6B38_366915 [Iris pallida]